MNYVHNIDLNFNKNYYNFYEWDNRNTKRYSKIPIIRVSNDIFNTMLNHNFKINNYIDTIIIITNTRHALGIKINNEGKCIYLSSILPEDEFDITNISYNIKEEKLDLKVFNKRSINYNTKYENDIINSLYKDNIDKLKYIYYEIYNENVNNKKYIINRIKYDIENNYTTSIKIMDILNTVNML